MLHSRGKPHDFEHTQKVIERVFQKPFEEVFEKFDEEPIGTGAIAQVSLYMLEFLPLGDPVLGISSNSKAGSHSSILP